MDRYLYFNGHSSEEYGAHIEYKPNIPTPAAKLQEYVVPGRSGKLHADLGYYDDITVTYQLYFHGKRPTAEELRPIKDWLCASPGPHDLADGYDPGYFYRATATLSNTANILDRYGRFQVQFSCDPRHFAVAGQQPQKLTNGQKLFNPLCPDGQAALGDHRQRAGRRPGSERPHFQADDFFRTARFSGVRDRGRLPGRRHQHQPDNQRPVPHAAAR